jgi:hypothetical protein
MWVRNFGFFTHGFPRFFGFNMAIWESLTNSRNCHPREPATFYVTPTAPEQKVLIKLSPN